MSQPQPPPGPAYRGRPVAPSGAARAPTRIEPLPGTPYHLAIYGPPPTTSGPAVGSLVAGVAGVLVSLIVACLGFADAGSTLGGQSGGGWGLLVGGAFAVLAVFLGLVGVSLGVIGMRRARATARPPARPIGAPAPYPYLLPGTPPPGTPHPGPYQRAPEPGSGEVEPVRGRGMAIAGLCCGGTALVIAICSTAVAALAAFS